MAHLSIRGFDERTTHEMTVIIMTRLWTARWKVWAQPYHPCHCV